MEHVESMNVESMNMKFVNVESMNNFKGNLDNYLRDNRGFK